MRLASLTATWVHRDMGRAYAQAGGLPSRTNHGLPVRGHLTWPVRESRSMAPPRLAQHVAEASVGIIVAGPGIDRLI